MYARLEELKQFQKIHKLGTFTLAGKIGINYMTLKRIINGLPLYNSTETIIDAFLDNQTETFDIKLLLSHKEKNKISNLRLCKEIGISYKTLFNTINDPLSVSDNTIKLIQNYLQKVC